MKTVCVKSANNLFRLVKEEYIVKQKGNYISERYVIESDIAGIEFQFQKNGNEFDYSDIKTLFDFKLSFTYKYGLQVIKDQLDELFEFLDFAYVYLQMGVDE